MLALLTDVSVSMPGLPLSGNEELPPRLDPAVLETDRIGTEEAARLLGLTSRQTRNLATVLGGRLVKGSWHFDRAAVAAEAQRRREALHD